MQMEPNNILALLVLSCDKYKYAWDDFFNLRDKFWANCPYKWYVVTETEDYKREGVEVIQCGKQLNWTGRFLHAAKTVGTEYVGIYLEDGFIEDFIKNEEIEEDLSLMEKYHIDMLNTAEEHDWIVGQKSKKYLEGNYSVISKHLPYGISATTSIWKVSFIEELLGGKDTNAWEFELDRCKEANSEEGMKGILVCDERQPMHSSRVPVIVQGMLYPRSIKHFKKRGYDINVSKYKKMAFKDVWRYNIKHYAAKLPFGKKPMKWIASHLLGYEFFSDTYKN